MAARPEDPERLRSFQARIRELKWGPEEVAGSLAVLHAAVDGLAEAEVRYYFRRRNTRAWISGLARAGAWLFGSVGLLIPMLSGADFDWFAGWEKLGYAFLAVAASCLAANSLFGGTDGHIRFVTTQLEIEKLVIVSRIEWCRYLSEQRQDPESLRRGFDLVLAYATELHALTIAETGRWGDTLLAELGKYRAAIEKRPS